MSKFKLLLVTLLLFILSSATVVAKSKTILVICPYVPSNSWGLRFLAPINQLANENADFNFQFSVLKCIDYKTADEIRERMNSIVGIYANERPDLVIIFGPSNYEAARIINNHWNDIPTILIGETEYICPVDYIMESYARRDVERSNISDMISELNCTYIKTPVYPNRTLDLMTALLPKMEEIFFVGGDDYMSKEIQLQLEDLSKDRGLRFTAYLSSDHKTDELVKAVQGLDHQKNGIIYCNWFSRVNEENNSDLSIRRLVEENAPAFTIYGQDNKNDDGIGYVSYDTEDYRQTVKNVVLKVLKDNIQPRSIVPTTLAARPAVINREALLKYNINKKLIPEDAIIENDHPSFWVAHRNDIMTFIIVVTLVFLLGLSLLLIRGRSLNRQLSSAKKRAESSDRSKTVFLQNMSHEIRTPMNAIVGFSQLLALPDGYSTEEEKKEYAGYIQNNAKMLMMLIDDILDIADAEHGNYRIDLSDASCNEICTSAMKSVEFRVPPGVDMNFKTDLPDDYKVHTDSRRVQQVLINYLTNACKHTLQGEIKVRCSSTENPGCITFSVTDTGTGIPPDMAENIFERFTKLDSFVQGSGLGLNICRTVAQKLGAQVKLDTTYTKGARFLFILPLH
ncbi:MAG: HAMP domain-containing histidine kinase [Bacteroidales bacterium]|nr:HAMP domain-containing histidine kinase [Bacteroidales bacterium]